MRVLMLGWEFPPHISGGLGTACFGMTKGLSEIGVEVCFVLPQAIPLDTASHVSLRTPENLALGDGDNGEEEQAGQDLKNVELHRVDAKLQAYATPAQYNETVRELIARQVASKGGLLGGADELTSTMPSGSFSVGMGANYGGDLISQVRRYADLVVALGKREAFDIIHAHDWMTFPAGLALAGATGKPLVVHVHSTEFDRSGENINTQVYGIERAGVRGADRIVCVSHLTRSVIISRYGVPPERTEVVYNAVQLPSSDDWPFSPIQHNEKIVLFLGRVTMQKGPEYFLRAAKMVVERFPNVRFVMAGSGDMIAQCVQEVANLKMGRYVTFTGFLRGDDVARVFRMADLYVMPSVSEPFGIAPLEALSHNVPVIISKQSGVSEVLTHVLKVDFWDIDEMANKILAVLRHPPLQRTLRQHGQIELNKLSWRDSAEKLKGIYCSVTG